MPHQSPVTVRAFLRDGTEPAVQELLERLRSEGLPRVNRAAAMAGVHFARMFLLGRVRDLDGVDIPASLVYMADVDGSVDLHLRTLSRVAGPWMDELVAHCESPPGPTPLERAAWLRAHRLDPAARYVHTIGRTVTRIHDEARLHDAIETMLDEPGLLPAAADRATARRRIRDAVLLRPDLAWAARHPAGPGLLFQLREDVRFAVLVLAVLLALPVLLVAAAVLLVLVRREEKREEQFSGPPPLEHIDAVRRYEDWAAQNPFTGCGFVKPSPVRKLTMRVALFGLDAANRHVFGRDQLAGVRSIHFARWVPIDEGRRLIFASSYDGSLESYMDDFITRLAMGINLVFTNGVGFPRARWLVFGGGARDEISYKHYLRRNLVPTTVFYSAYPRLTAPVVDANSRIRAGLATDDATPDDEWLAQL